jgi:hypothetical protein
MSRINQPQQMASSTPPQRAEGVVSTLRVEVSSMLPQSFQQLHVNICLKKCFKWKLTIQMLIEGFFLFPRK